MDETSLAIMADNDGVPNKDVTMPEDPGDEVASQSDSDSSSIDEGDESDKPEPPPLHKKLLAIAEAEQSTKAALSADFNTLLVRSLSEINAQDSDGKTALHIAIEHGLNPEARNLVQNEADIGTGDNDGQQPIYLACLDGNTELVELLLSKNTAVNAADNTGETPLAAACRKGHTQIVNLLLEKKANTNTWGETKWTPIHWASWENHVEILKRLLGEDTNINPIEMNENWTPLNAAIYRGHEIVVSLLLERNADLYIPDSSNWTPLMTATRRQHLQIVRTILRYKKLWKKDYLEIRDSGANTPLHVASYRGYSEIASQLIDAGANCNVTDKEDMTPLHLASLQNHPQIVALLLQRAVELGIDIDAKAKARNGRTSLHLASLQGNELIVKALLEGKASIDAIDELGLTPLHLASGAKVENRDLSDPDTGSPGPNGEDDAEGEKRNPEAESGRYLQVVELLLRNGAHTHLKDEKGNTALHRAAAIGDKGRIDVLLENMKKEDLSWEDWEDSPLRSALLGDDSQSAMKSLLVKKEIKEAPFWKHDGRFQVIREILKNSKPQEMLRLMIRGVSGERQKPPEGFESWSVIQWAAFERLPAELSELIDKSGPDEELYEMVYEALRTTSRTITLPELLSETSCEKLVQVFAILITNSTRVPKTTDIVNETSLLVKNLISPTQEAEERLGERSSLGPEQVLKLEQSKKSPTTMLGSKMFITTKDKGKLEDSQQQHRSHFGHRAPKSKGRGMKGLQTDTIRAGKSLTNVGKLQDILKDPPFNQTSRTYKDEAHYKLPVARLNHRPIVAEAEATVVAFYRGDSESGRIRRNRTLQEMIYDSGPTKVVKRAIDDLIGLETGGFIHFNNELYDQQNLKLTWVHLPSTNMVWMNDLLTTIMHNERYQTQEYSKARSFFRDSWVVVPDKESQSRMMRPQSVIRPKPKKADGEDSGAGEDNTNDPGKVEAAVADSKEGEKKCGSDGDSESRQPTKKHEFAHASAIYMPYLAYSTHCGEFSGTQDSKLKEAYQANQSLLDSYNGKDEQQHGSPTLDEWYYQFAQDDPEARDDERERNRSQVVSKYLKEDKEGSRASKLNQWTVVRVNQLWVWTIADNWIITSTSSPFDNSPDVLVDEILNLLSKQAEYGGSRAQPVSATELVPVIIDHCIGSYDRRPNHPGRISIAQTFSHYINKIGRDETNLFNDFRAGSSGEHQRNKANSKWYKRFSGKALLEDIKKRTAKAAPGDTLANTAETKQSKRREPSPVKDLLEVTEERTAGADPASLIANTAETKQTTVQLHNHDIGSAIKEAKDLCFYIKDVRDELSILRSVAGYQQTVQTGLGGKAVDESRLSSTYVLKNLRELDSVAERIQSAINTTLSLQQSEVANDQATEATRQGKTVMTFTFATVLFLPLSFLSSLFALDVASFQEAPAWTFYVIFFVSIGISVILGFSVFYWEDIKHASKMLFEIVKKVVKGFSSPISLPSKLPKKEATGSKDTGRRDTVVSIPSKSKDGEPRFRRLFKRHGRKATADDIENGTPTSKD